MAHDSYKNKDYKFRGGEIVILANGKKGIMVIRDSKLWLILQDGGHLNGGKDFVARIRDYDCIASEPFKIAEVHYPPMPIFDANLNAYTLIYKADTTVELTLKEVADRFGIPLEQLRIKE